MTGTVFCSINNIYTIQGSDGKLYLCRIKGKRLAQSEGEYNPVVVGDSVEFDAISETEGLVLSRNPRRTEFARWNVKNQKNQTIAANMDEVICVCSVESPPFRPRFIDRVIACCKNVPIIICMNKSDILMTEDEYDRFSLYSKLGYQVIAVSAQTGENIAELKEKIRNKTVTFVGQSGVGKSSLVNKLLGANQKVGGISEKYNRGCHTTNHSLMFTGQDFTLIDTPGFREISVPHDDIHSVAKSFPEFLDCKCAYESCLHVNEPDCVVRQRVLDGTINADRYESYLGILQGMEDREPVWKRNK